MEELPQEARTLIGLAVIALTMIMTPKPLLQLLGRIRIGQGLRPFSPNWLTVWSGIITLGAFFLLWPEHPEWCLPIALFGGLLDRLDGRAAFALGQTLSDPRRWLETDTELRARVKPQDGETTTVTVPNRSRFGRLWFELNFDGGTDLGAVLDPFLDKVKAVILVAYFAAVGILAWWLVIAMVIPEVLSTLMRRPFYWFEATGARATGFGKWKAVAQWLVIIASLSYELKWFLDDAMVSEYAWVPNAMLGFTVVLAYASVISRFIQSWGSEKLDSAMSVVSMSLDHGPSDAQKEQKRG